ncbi:NAD-glutamate dehydrogenase [Longimicrobium sp.]|uniref:NAD-glutamate dehydrogenase n=1 Tax=Longimicrobium sp. TaxID=2029185 RepID=UPI002CC0F5D3|nr:NAD-glutamate dehydrogenase domain-containing protein [Longimicrobium sp.]HSU14266.1 NAD-glutamate dehydrogenase domain-containing protein [Longimicrobium sp.]
MSTVTLPSSAQSVTVDELCNYIGTQGRADQQLACDFARIFFGRIPRTLLEERSVEELAAMTLGAWEFLKRARPDQVNAEVTDPRDEGWKAPVTVIRTEVGDRPFIVDTIREYLNAENIPILHYVYPVLRVQRAEDGAITAVGTGAGGGEGLEALGHVEIPHVPRRERAAEIREEVRRRLSDVVEATRDFAAMVRQVERVQAAVAGYVRRFPDRAREYGEYLEFLGWLREGNFVFLGARAYEIAGEGEQAVVRVEKGSGLGILADEDRSQYADPQRIGTMQPALRERVLRGPLLIVSKANRESTVHRLARMDYIGVKRLDEQGNVVGEWRFLGLFTSQAYGQNPAEIPIVRHKVRSLLEQDGARPGSHDYKEIISILHEMPKEELFQASTGQLRDEVDAVLGHLFSDEVRVVLRPDPLRNEAAVMVILPRGRFSNRIRKEIGAMLERRLGATLRSSNPAGAADQARIHYYLTGRDGAAPGQGDVAATERDLEAGIGELLRSWEDLLEERLAHAVDAGEARRLAQAYGQVVGADYRAANNPLATVPDVLRMDEMLRAGQTVSLLLRPAVDGELVAAGATVLRLYLAGERLVLSDFMPILEDHGVKVLEVDTFEFQPSDELPHLMVYSFHVQTRAGEPIPPELFGALAESLLASRAGDAERDAYAALTLLAGLRWREVDVVRTYANYASQIGAVPSRLAPVRAFTTHPHFARLLIDLFHARLSPEKKTTKAEMQGLRQTVLVELEKVTSLADDRALRRLMNLVEATVRTNYFRHGGADPVFRSGGVPYISVKVRSADVEDLKKTRLLYEVYVHSARMEGVHLRAAPVSRGGIRWSDRPDDFRTEILGLVLTQVVKNATIVPSGSKGGFITKRQPADRDAQMEEARQQYMTLMRGLLDLTDNLVDGRVVPPPDVVRHDGDDPYLVVAADKGTAHLSDTANAVAAEYGFWLDDAFASGGSQGYDHKVEGITARGAWECVKRHFREMGTDIQTQPFTVAGIGDMSGDVFGNGMLLSPVIRLVAAFDHRHIFIDPDPDPARSFAERKRMFDLPRSSWDDYDRSVLSPGAMIVPRASKEVELTPEARAALGLADGVGRLDGEGLVRAVLKAPVDLLWNGGIGTYVRSPDETNADVGDTSNDPVRIESGELRAKVVGEGGNLGFTQQGRIDFALRGGKINTDALDNSAGVDMSDHEVNLKILVGRVVRDGDLAMEGRNELLRSMTGDVNRLVLRNNFGQSLAVSLDELRSREALDDFASFMEARARDGRLDPAAEGMPDAEGLRARRQNKTGLTRPTLAVLLAHAKLQAKGALLESTVPDDPATDEYLVDYFPPAAVEAAGPARLREHRLRREIITTELVNDLVNLMGSSFLHRVSRDTGRGIAEVVRAWLVASRVAGAPEIRADLAGAEGRFPSETIYRWLNGLARVLEQTTHWLLANLPDGGDTGALIEEARTGLSALRGSFGKFVAGDDRTMFHDRLRELEQLGVEKALGERIITLRFLPQLLEIVHAARGAGTEEIRTARAFYAVSEKLGTARLREGLRVAAGDNPWERRYAGALGDDLTGAQRVVVAAVLRGGEDPARALAALEKAHPREFRAYRDLTAELSAGDCPLAAFALAVRQLQAVAIALTANAS